MMANHPFAGSSRSSAGPSRPSGPSTGPANHVSTLFNHINERRARQSLRTLTDSGEKSFSVLLGKIKAFNILAQNPLGMSNTNLFSHSLETNVNSNEVCYYLRLYSIPRKKLEQYMVDYCADKDWAQKILDKCPDKNLFIPYVGMTHKTTPQHRAKDDMDVLKWSRLKNLQNLFDGGKNEPVALYELYRSYLKADLDVRKDPKYDEIEQNLIAIVFPYCLNSASGGYFYHWTAPQDFRSKLLQAVPKAVTLPETSQAPIDLIAAIQEQQLFNFAVFANIVNDPQSLVALTALQEIISDAKDISMHGKRVLSVLVTKDIPKEAMKGGFAYNSLTAGRAARIEHQIRNNLVSGLSIPRLDIWQFTEVHRDVAVAIALLSQSLQALRPILIVSHSSKVANILQSDMLAQITDASKQLAMVDRSRPNSDLCKSLRGDTSQWKELQHPAFLGVIGTLSIVKYGPGANDCALYLPERDPGNIAYDPSMAPLYSELHYLCKAKFIMTCHEIVQWEQPLDSLERLTEIRLVIEDKWKKSESDGSPSLHELFEMKREQVAKRQLELVSARQNASKARNQEQDFHSNAYPLRDKTQALGPPVPDHILQANTELVTSELFPDFKVRIEQWKEYSELLKDRQDRGIYHLKSFCPSSVTSCSTEHRDWFLKVPEGKHLSMSARSYGTQHFVNNPEGLQEFMTRNKKFGVERSGFFLENIELALRNMNKYYANQYNTSFFYLARCRTCDREEIGALETSHHCHETEGESTTLGKCSWLKPLYFAHDIFDLLAEGDYEYVKNAGGWKVRLASDIVRECAWIPDHIKEMDPPQDVVYYTDKTHSDFLIVMAMDRYLQTHVRCDFQADNGIRPHDDNWTTPFNINFIMEYVRDNARSRWPIIATRCADANRPCQYLRPAFPTVSPNGQLQNPKHKCLRDGRAGKPGRFTSNFMTSIFDFPLELARRYWTLTGRHDKGKANHDSKTDLLNWRVSDEGMELFKAGLGNRIIQ